MTASTREAAEAASPSSSRGVGVFKWTVGVYSAFLVALIPLFLWAGRGGWFQHDDWDYLVLRKAGDPGDLFRPHSGHWETIPVLAYRALWAMFGLRYRPYQLLSIVASLVGAALLLIVILRSRTRPWIAILTVTLLVFFGDAQANVALRVTSITFVGFAVPLGLIHLMLADHDGPIDRRDWFGLAAGLLGLLCSGVAVAMVFVVGVTMLVKRGRRIALFHVLPAAIVFSLWYLSIGRNDNVAGQPARLHSLPSAVHFAWVLVTGTFGSLSRASVLGGVVVAALVVGVVLAARHVAPERRSDAVVPCAMLLGALFFAIETGLGRADLLKVGASAVLAGHYMDVVAYLSLPAVAWLIEAVVRHWRRVMPAVLVGFLVLIPLNARAFVSHANASRQRQILFRNTVLLIPRLPLATKVPRSIEPYVGVASPITVGWLLDSAREGRLPVRRHATEANRAIASMRISLVIASNTPTQCRPFVRAVVRRLARGGSFRFRGRGILVGDVRARQAVVSYTTSDRPGEWRITNVGSPLLLRFAPVSDKLPRPMLCA